MTSNSDLRPLAERVQTSDAGGFRVLALSTPVEKVVSFTGSFRTDPDFAAEEEVIQQLAVSLLDKGTVRRDRFAIAEALDDRGAQLTFSASGLRCSFSGRCLREDLEDVLGLIAEQLREPLFDADEFRKARAQQIASVKRVAEDTGSQAHGLLARHFFGPAHPNFRPQIEKDLRALEQATIDQVKQFHRDHFGGRDGAIVLVGDLDQGHVERVTRDLFGDWSPGPRASEFETAARDADSGREAYMMDDRQNLDVRIGHPLTLRRDSDDYLALYAGVYALGGNFSARLMGTVRDEQGLTYGIGARLSGVSMYHDCYFLTSVTLSQENLDRGIDATLEQVEAFVRDGITAEELDEKQTTLAGQFKVGMATTRGLSSALLSNAERGFDVGYLDRFPDLVHGLTLGEVNDAIARHLDADRLFVGIAGTLPSVKTEAG